METVDVRGRFVWHQLLTRDVPGAKKFYSSLVGWKAEPWPLDPSYTVCQAGDVPTAGMMAMAPEFPAEVPPHWMQYIGTRDVDGTAEAAVLAGGYIVKQPSDMKGAGRYAVLADPQGAVFAIIDPENARAEPSGTPPLAAFTWHELATTDNEAAFAFYANLFGWEPITRIDMGSNVGVYLIFGQGGQQKGGMYIKPPDMPGQAFWLPYVHVPSVDAAVEVVRAGGGSIAQAPMEVPGGSRIAVIIDPAGAAFALNSFPAAAGAVATAPPKPKAKVATKPKAKTKAKAKVKAKAKPRPKVKTKVKPKARPKVKARAASRSKVAKKSKAKKKGKTVRRKK